MKISILKKAGIEVIVLLIVGMLFTLAHASSEIDLKVTSLTNVKGNGTLEACGTAFHVKGIKPLMVTVTHDASSYSILTSQTGVWCVVIKRWTFEGKIEAYASTLDGVQKSDVLLVQKSAVHE